MVVVAPAGVEVDFAADSGVGSVAGVVDSLIKPHADFVVAGGNSKEVAEQAGTEEAGTAVEID